jgi:hypothetical protein
MLALTIDPAFFARLARKGRSATIGQGRVRLKISWSAREGAHQFENLCIVHRAEGGNSFRLMCPKRHGCQRQRMPHFAGN